MHRALFVLMLAASAGAHAQVASVNRCAECHLMRPNAPAPGHVMDWEASGHRRAGVNCERCHGGRPLTSALTLAHLGVMNPRESTSPLNRRNITATCGACHAGPLAAFQRSQHNELLRTGDTRGPTCVTCHGAVAAQRLSPAAIEGQCDQCHGPGKTAPRPERASDMRRWLEEVRGLRAQLDTARVMIDAARDPARRQELLDSHREAAAPLAQAVVSGHSFVFTNRQQLLNVARQRTADLYRSLAGSPSR
jgi:hypothetical protein